MSGFAPLTSTDDENDDHQAQDISNNNDSPTSSLKVRAQSLWGDLRNTVVHTTHQIKGTLQNPSGDRVVTYTKPICLEGRHCRHADDREHMRMFRHLCPYGSQCNSKHFPSHENDFVHNTTSTEEALLIRDPNDNKVKSAAKENAIDNNNKSKGAIAGALDFLDDLTSSSKKGNTNEPNLLGAIKDSNSNSIESSYANAMSTPNRPKNLPIYRMSPIRVFYGMQEWHIWFYDQRAQWPLDGEVLTKEDMILTFGKESVDDAQRWLNNGGNEEDEKSPSAVDKAVDKAKAFFDDLFGVVKGKNNDNNNTGKSNVSSSQPADGAHRALASKENDPFGEENSSLLSGGNGGEHREKEMDKGFW